MSKTRCEPLWLALGLCPIQQTLFITAWSNSAGEAVRLSNERFCEHGATYTRAFQLTDSERATLDGEELRDWFRSCGVTTADATELVREFGRTLGEHIREIGNERGWD